MPQLRDLQPSDGLPLRRWATYYAQCLMYVHGNTLECCLRHSLNVNSATRDKEIEYKRIRIVT